MLPSAIKVASLNCTINGIEKQRFCNIFSFQIMENENGLLT